jgi:TatD DNase family protein
MNTFPMIDSHTHVYSYSENELKHVMDRAFKYGVSTIIDSSVDIASAQKVDKLSSENKNIFGGIGIHPQNLKATISKKEISEIYNYFSNNKKNIVVSEIGLDFQSNSPDRIIQYDAFRKQIGIARELNKPIIFHSRNSIKETIKILKEERAFEVGGAMHYFQSNLNIANEITHMGFKLSFAKPLLRNINLESVIKNISLEDIIIETDSAPQPFKKNRSNWTEPKDCKLIVDKIARIKGYQKDAIHQKIFFNTFNMLKNGSRWLETSHFM